MTHSCVPAALAVAVCLVCNGLAGYAFTQVFPLVLATLKAHGFLYLLASIEVAAILTVLLVLPETKVCLSLLFLSQALSHFNPQLCVYWVVALGGCTGWLHWVVAQSTIH